MKWECLVLLASLVISRELFRKLRLGDVPKVRLFVFLKLVLPFQEVRAESHSEHCQ